MKSSLENTNKTIAKFVEGEKNLNMLLHQQKLVLDKMELDIMESTKIDKSYFVKATQNTCNYCDEICHITHTCAIRNGLNGNIKGK